MAPTRKPETMPMKKYRSKHSLQAIIDQDKVPKARTVADKDTDAHQSQLHQQNSSASTIILPCCVSNSRAKFAKWAHEAWHLYCINWKCQGRIEALGDESRSKNLPSAPRSLCKDHKKIRSSPTSTKGIQKVQTKSLHTTKDERGRTIVRPRATQNEASPFAKDTHDFTQRRRYQCKLESRKRLFQRRTVMACPMEVDYEQNECVDCVVEFRDLNKATDSIRSDLVILAPVSDRGTKRLFEEDTFSGLITRPKKIRKTFHISQINKPSVPPLGIAITIPTPVARKTSEKREPARELTSAIAHHGVFPFNARSYQMQERRENCTNPDSFPCLRLQESSIVIDENLLEPQGDTTFNHRFAADIEEITERLAFLDIDVVATPSDTAPTIIVEAATRQVMRPAPQSMVETPLSIFSPAEISNSQFSSLPAALAIPATTPEPDVEMDCSIQSEILIAGPVRTENISAQADLQSSTESEPDAMMNCSNQSASVLPMSLRTGLTSPQTKAQRNANAKSQQQNFAVTTSSPFHPQQKFVVAMTPRPQPQPPTVSIKIKPTKSKYSMKCIEDCLKNYVPCRQHNFIFNLAREWEHMNIMKRPWEEDFVNPRAVTMLYSILRFGPACDWIGTPFLALDGVPPPTKRKHRQILRDALRTDYELWLDILTTAMQFGLHPRDLLPDNSGFKQMIFGEDDKFYIDNVLLDDDHARSRYGLRLPVQQEQISQPYEDSFLVISNIAKEGTLDILQSAVENWLLDGQILGPDDLAERLGEFHAAMQKAGITTAEHAALISLREWIIGTAMDEWSEEQEEFMDLLHQLLMWRYPRSMRYGPTRELATAVCDLDDDSDEDDDDGRAKLQKGRTYAVHIRRPRTISHSKPTN